MIERYAHQIGKAAVAVHDLALLVHDHGLEGGAGKRRHAFDLLMIALEVHQFLPRPLFRGDIVHQPVEQQAELFCVIAAVHGKPVVEIRLAVDEVGQRILHMADTRRVPCSAMLSPISSSSTETRTLSVRCNIQKKA